MQKHRFFTLFAGLAALVLLCACQQNTHVSSPQEEIAPVYMQFMVRQDADPNDPLNETYQVQPVQWDAASGSLQVSETPALTVASEGGLSQFRLQWEGGDLFTFGGDATVLPEDGYQVAQRPLPPSFHGSSGADFQLSLDLGQGTAELTVTNGETVSFSGLDQLAQKVGLTVPLTMAHYLTSDYENGSARAVFMVPGSQESGLPVSSGALFWMILNAQTGEAICSQLVPVSDGDAHYAHGLLSSEEFTTAIVEDRFYFAAGNTVAYLDLNEGSLGNFLSVTRRLDQLFPDAAPLMTEAGPAKFSLWGSTDTSVVAAIEYGQEDGSATHFILLDITPGGLAGVLCLTTGEDGSVCADTYDAQMEPLEHQILDLKQPYLLQMGFSVWS